MHTHSVFTHTCMVCAHTPTVQRSRAKASPPSVLTAVPGTLSMPCVSSAAHLLVGPGSAVSTLCITQCCTPVLPEGKSTLQLTLLTWEWPGPASAPWTGGEAWCQQTMQGGQEWTRGQPWRGGSPRLPRSFTAVRTKDSSHV